MTLHVDERTEDKLRRIPVALHAEFPDVPEEELAAEVEATAQELLETARIDAFVPVLVHRYAREHVLERRPGAAHPVDLVGPEDLTSAA
jgi:hypothetical protein